MITEELAGFLSAWCSLDCDPGETTALLNGPSRDYFLSWLPHDLEAAIRTGSLTPEAMEDLTHFAFDDQAAVNGWIRENWKTWRFEGPPPV
ncbi:hypothetical protein ACFOWE_32800 [Planomonospora corallina]|uniref:Uncharacterized protein n=1 Tax=Planomonospora corallina TaxID=1806052 RepID=A0ABV8IJE0_9ACTN